MRSILLAMVLMVSFMGLTIGQSITFETRIKATGTIEDEGVTLTVSSDDAEQENDAIDALTDDDIDAGWEGEDGDANILTAGMRFRDIFIPQGALIVNAYIVVTSHEAKTAEDVAELTIYAEATDNAATFTEDALITDRMPTTAKVDWTVAEEWGLYTDHNTADLSPVVQEIVNREGWKSGNAIAFIFQGKDQGPSDVENAREWEAFENIADPEDGGDGQNHPERVAKLVVEYTVESAAFSTRVQKTGTIEEGGVSLDVSSDDAEQENDAIDSLTDDDIDAGWEGDDGDANILTAGIRFVNIPVPAGAIVESAFIDVWSHEGKTVDDVAQLTIYAEATDSAATFTEDALITDRMSTEAQVKWTVAEEWGLYTQQQTPDLGPIVQEIIDRDGWKAGNAIAFIFAGEDQGPSEVENAREWEAFENIAAPEDGGDGQNHPERVAQLTINWRSGTTGIFTSKVEVNTLKVYPNPATQGFVTVELEETKASLINLYNNNGQLLRTQKFDNNNMVNFDVSNLPAGMYYIQARQGYNLYIQKLMIK